MHTKLGKPDRYPSFDRIVLALKAARVQKGISRKEVVSLLGWSRSSIEQIENGRCNLSQERIEKIASAYGYTRADFESILKSPKLVLAKAVNEGKKDQTVERKPRRNHFKIVTKEVRVIRALRLRKGISQYQASRLCGYVPGGFGHIEVGRINLTSERIDHILSCLGCTREDFNELMGASKLRDEMIEECKKCLGALNDTKLESALTVLTALRK